MLPREASCRLAAEAELSYVNYDARDNIQRVSEHSLTQRYSVIYDKSGKFVDGRLGRYDVALGYEWLTFDTDIKSSAAPSENFSETKGKLYYKGEVLIDPKEIPFRLSLYSRDMSRSTFNTSESNNSQIFGAQQSTLTTTGNSELSSSSHYISVPSMTATGIIGGSSVENGATLVMGVKNGMTNGYNDSLRHLPMLMLDYRDVVNKDKDGRFPVDNRLSRLAFVSLNKKDNWFHYRYVTYDDYIDKSNNYIETQFQLGTVDHLLQRRWIDFSNWLSVSVDGQLTKRVQARTEENFEEFSLNLFGTARRQSWEMRTLNNFTRYNEINLDRITYMTSVPVYANGIISPTANWSANTKYNDNRTDKGAYFRTVAGAYNIDTFRKSSFTFSQGLSVEQVNSSDSSDILIMSGNASTTSTPKFSRDVTLKAAYNIRNYRSNFNDNVSNFTEQELIGTASYNLNNKMRTTVEQTNRLTSGTSPSLSSSVPGAVLNSPQYIASPDGTTVNSASYQSITKFEFAWTPRPRLNVTFSVSEDIVTPTSGERTYVSKVSAIVKYSANQLNLSSKTDYETGDANYTGNTNFIRSTNSARYIFSRNLDTNVGISYYKTFEDSNRIDTINVDQSVNYNYYRVDGAIGKLFEINESFASSEELVSYQGTNETIITTKQRTNTLLLGAKYYPLRQMMIAGGARYSFVNGFENDAVNYYGSLSLSFQLLEASLDYTCGKNKTDNRVEKRISANVKKKF